MCTLIPSSNRRSVNVCSASSCTKKHDLKYMRNGFFCKEHQQELRNIRMNIKKSCTIDDEISWRQQEIQFRKHPDIGHIYYVDRLITIADRRLQT